MRHINGLMLLTGICFCVAGCAMQGAKKDNSQNLSKSLDVWACFLEDAEADMKDVWSIDENILICKGKPLGYIYTKKDYHDFVLTLEWRWPPGKKAGNGGVLFRMTGGHEIWPRSLEAQLNADNAGDFWGLDGYSLSGPAERKRTLNHEKFGKLTNLKKLKGLENPPGEWNTYKIIAKGSTVTLIINGEEVNKATGCDLTPGKICLTSEGDEIHFRNIVVTSCDNNHDTNDQQAFSPKTIVSIKENKFLINNTPTYQGRTWNGKPIEGLLMNSRMVQGVFDDMNPETAKRWIYPDTQLWDAERNTDEFVMAMETWLEHGLLAVTVNLQGGSPMGYGNRGWYNSTFTKTGELRPEYQRRMERILARADELGMVIILGLFYFGQDQYLDDEASILRAVDNAIDWLLDTGYRNILIEVNNECNVRAYDHDILKEDRVHELILRVKNKTKDGFRFLVGTSYGGNYIPKSNVVKTSDFILIHGNGVSDPARITEMVKLTKQVPGYRLQPILFNEDDHYDFDKPMNNMVAAVNAYASWGFFDFRRKGEAFEEGYQCPPVDWGINSERKKGFFNKVKEITGY